MNTKEKVYELLKLHPDIYLSGEDIAWKLGISRTAVWHAVTALRKEGITIDAVTKRGYRLGQERHPHDEKILRKHLIKELRDTPIRIYPSVGSTNDELIKDAAKECLPSFTIYLAEEQTAGKGRMGKNFLSPAYSGIYLSILLQKKDGYSLSLLTIKAAVALILALEKASGKILAIKWVNDIYQNGKKIAGILTEGIIKDGDISRAIVGIGVNFNTDQDSFPRDLRSKAGSLFAEHVQRDPLTAEIINSFYRVMTSMSKDEILSIYRAKNLVLGKKVSFLINDVSYVGTAKDINEEGNLIVITGDTTFILNSGEVSIQGDWT